MAIGDGGGGKVKAKRNHGSKPYARNNTTDNKSLFRRVTESVANLLVPTWMPNFMSWHSNPEDDEEVIPSADTNRHHLNINEDDADVDVDLPEITGSDVEPNDGAGGSSDGPVSCSPMEGLSAVPPLQFWPQISKTTIVTSESAEDRSFDSGAFSSQSTLSCNNNNEQGGPTANWLNNDDTSAVGRNGLGRKIGRRGTRDSSYSRTNLLSPSGSMLPPTGDMQLSSNSFKEPVTDNNSECSDTSVSTSGCSSMIPHPDKREYQKEILQLNESSLRQLSEKLSSSSNSSVVNSSRIGTKRTGNSGPTARPPLRLNSHGFSSQSVSLRGSASETFSGPMNEDDSGEMNLSVQNQSNLWSMENGSVQTTPRRDSFSSLSGGLGSTRSRPQSTSVGRKPSFTVSAFGNPVWNEKSVLNDPLMSSPYYSGRTCYGGASAFKRSRLQQAVGSPYNLPSSIVKRQQVKVKVCHTVDDVNNLDGMSVTSRRILDALETMSTPVKDAKRMPDGRSNRVDTPFPSLSSITRRPKLSGPNEDFLLKSGSSFGGPPTIKMVTPSRASSVIKNVNRAHQPVQQKQPVSSVTDRGLKSQQAASDARQIASPPPPERTTGAPSASDLPTYSGGSSSSSRKIKSSRRDHYSRKQDAEDMVSEPVELPNIALPLSSLPTFKFDLTKVSAVNTAKSCPVTSKQKEELPQTSTGTGSDVRPTNFDFCQPAPVVKRSSSVMETVSDDSEQLQDMSFTFSSPLQVVSAGIEKPPKSAVITTTAVSTPAKETPVTTASGSSLPSFNFVYEKAQVTPKSKPVEKEEDEDIVPSPPVASELMSGSVMDLLRGKESKDSASPAAIGFGSLYKPPTNTWECTTCLVFNKESANECIACTTPKPGAELASTAGPSGFSFGISPAVTSNATVSASTSSSSTGFGSLFKAPVGNWKCPTCDVSNTADVGKCVCCDTPKPGDAPKASVAAAPVPATQPTSGSGKQWECDTCLVRNQPETTRCIACQTPRSDSISGPPAGGLSFSFGSSTAPATGFKLGPVDNSTPTTFKFGFPSTSSSTPVSTAAVTTATTGFGFTTTAVSNTASTASTTNSGFVFGIPTKTSDSTKAPQSFAFGASTLTQKKDGDEVEGKKDDGNKAAKFPFSLGKADSEKSGNFSFGNSVAHVAQPTTGKSESAPQFGFEFGAEKSATTVEKAPAGNQKPVFGGVNFSKPSTSSQDVGSLFATPTATRGDKPVEEPLPEYQPPAKLVTGKHKSSDDCDEPSRKIPSIAGQSEMPKGQFSFGQGIFNSGGTSSTVSGSAKPTVSGSSSLFSGTANATQPTATSSSVFGGGKSSPLATPGPSFFFGSTAQKPAPTTSIPSSHFSGMSTPGSTTSTSTTASLFGTATTNSVFAPTSSASIFQAPSVTSSTATSGGGGFFGGSSMTSAATKGTLFQTNSAPAAITTSSSTAPPASQSFFSFSAVPQATSVTASAGFGTQSMGFNSNNGSGTATLPSLSFGNQTASTSTSMVNPPAFGAAQPAQGFASGAQNNTPGLFSFGAPLGGNANTASGNNATPASSNLFGAASSGTMPAFGSNQLASSTSSFGSSGGATGFGSASGTGTNPTPGTAPANRMFFNQTPSFQFGVDNQSSPGVFTFTGTQDPSQPEQTSTFQFSQPSAGAPGVSQGGGGFQFNPLAGAPQFNFGVGSTNPMGTMPPNPSPLPAFNTGAANPTSSQNRQIRRARRRKP